MKDDIVIVSAARTPVGSFRAYGFYVGPRASGRSHQALGRSHQIGSIYLIGRCAAADKAKISPAPAAMLCPVTKR